MAGTITQSVFTTTENWKVVKFACVADASNGTLPATAFDAYIDKYIDDWGLYKVGYNVGATAPTASSDMVVADFTGHDVLGGGGANLITTSDGEALPLIGTQPAI